MEKTPPTQLSDPILIQDDVVAMTRMCRMTIYRRRRAGIFPPGFRNAEKILWRRSEIENYLSQIETTGRWVKR